MDISYYQSGHNRADILIGRILSRIGMKGDTILISGAGPNDAEHLLLWISCL
jgi:hypothetical protein